MLEQIKFSVYAIKINMKNLEIDAIDFSNETLEKLNIKSDNFKNINIFQKDMKNFDMNKKYECILINSNFLNYIF